MRLCALVLIGADNEVDTMPGYAYLIGVLPILITVWLLNDRRSHRISNERLKQEQPQLVVRVIRRANPVLHPFSLCFMQSLVTANPNEYLPLLRAYAIVHTAPKHLAVRQSLHGQLRNEVSVGLVHCGLCTQFGDLFASQVLCSVIGCKSICLVCFCSLRSTKRRPPLSGPSSTSGCSRRCGRA